MLTLSQPEIKLFLDDLFENVLPRGEIKRLLEFYTPDVIGHQNDKNFNLEDIKIRLKILKTHQAAYFYKIENFTVINDLIALVVRQQWLEKVEKEFYEAILTVIYRMRENKICELWILADRPIPDYKQQNIDFRLGTNSFNMADKAKRSFIARLCLSEFFRLNPKIRLSKKEKECLHCYLNGFSAKETAQLLSLSPRTIETHIANIKAKLDCHTKNELRNKLFPKTKK